MSDKNNPEDLINTRQVPREEAREKKKLNRIGQGVNPFWSVFWKFLVCCAIIDAGIMAYFNFVKGVPVMIGLQQIQAEIFQGSKPKKIA